MAVICIFAVSCSEWSSTVSSDGCIASLLVNNGWANTTDLSSDDQLIALKMALNLHLNGTFHSIVELSGR
jgi:hypothetical protein